MAWRAALSATRTRFAGRAPFPGSAAAGPGGRDVRDKCRQMISTLDIPDPFDLDEFCLGLERRRGRSISMVPISIMPGAPCGMWVGAADGDYIFYERGTSALHRQHIIMHEIGHLLFGHRDGLTGARGLTALLLPDLDPDLIKSMLGRTSYDSVQEMEAETFADLISLIVNPLTRRNSGRRRPPRPEQAEIISRIENTVGRY